MKLHHLLSISVLGLTLLAPVSYAQDDLSKTAGDRNEVGDFAPPADENGVAHMPGSREDFDRLDTRKRGYLTAEDVRSDGWLTRNFGRCNLSHTGRMTWDEFSGCGS
jgi:hypothetical protein